MRWVTFCSAVIWATLAVSAVLQADEKTVEPNAAAATSASDPAATPPAAKSVEERIAAIEAQTQRTNDTLNEILKQLAARKPAIPPAPASSDGAVLGAEKSKSAEPPENKIDKKEGEAQKVVALKPPALEADSAETDSLLRDLARRVAALEQLSAEAEATLVKIQGDMERLAPVVDVLSNLRVLKDTALKETASKVAPPHTSKLGEDAGEPQIPKDVLGKLTIQNDTNSTQTMLVNGKSYEVLPGTRDLWIPKGELTTQLKGLESAKTWSTDDWTWSRQDFVMKIIIEN